jgi:NADH-quinone oxidoreductase subunit N
MYFDAPTNATAVSAPAGAQVVLCINAGLVLMVGIFPGGLMTLCANAIRQMLGS